MILKPIIPNFVSLIIQTLDISTVNVKVIGYLKVTKPKLTLSFQAVFFLLVKSVDEAVFLFLSFMGGNFNSILNIN